MTFPSGTLAKHPPGVGLDRTNVLCKGLVGAWLINEGIGCSSVRDYGSGRRHGVMTSMDSTSDWITSDFGPALDFTGSDSNRLVCGSNAAIRDYPFTLAICGHRKAGANLGVSIANSSAADQYVSIGIGGGTFKVTGFIHNGTLDKTEGTTVLSVGDSFFGVFSVHSTTSRKIYYNGKLEATNTASHAFPTGLNTTSLGAILGSTPVYGYTELAYGLAWNRALSDGEVKLLYEQGVQSLLDPYPLEKLLTFYRRRATFA